MGMEVSLTDKSAPLFKKIKEIDKKAINLWYVMNTSDTWNVPIGRCAHSLNKKVPTALECDNYIENHNSSECPKVRDEAAMKQNKTTRLAKKGNKSGVGGSTWMKRGDKSKAPPN